jgi:hypothetical protein
MPILSEWLTCAELRSLEGRVLFVMFIAHFSSIESDCSRRNLTRLPHLRIHRLVSGTSDDLAGCSPRSYLFFFRGRDELLEPASTPTSKANRWRAATSLPTTASVAVSPEGPYAGCGSMVIRVAASPGGPR